MPTNAMGREAAAPGRGSTGGRSNADRDREAAKALSGGGAPQGTGAGVPSFSRTKMKKTPTKPATMQNLAAAIGGTLLGGLMPGIGMGLGPIGMDMMGLGFEGETGTGVRQEADSPNRMAAAPATPAPPKKKTTKPKNPLGSVGTILAGAGGSLSSGGL
jgi:hypothetical protein